MATTLVMVAAGLSWSGTAAAAPAKRPSGGAAVAPPGDGGWKPAKPPKSTTAPYKARAGTGGPPVLKPDPKAKRVKELTDHRTVNSSYFQMSDGSVQQEVSAAPVNYRDAKGAWHSIDSTVKPLSHNGFTAGAQGNSLQTYFSEDAASLLRIEQGPVSVQLGADGASTTARKTSGASVSYLHAYPGADLTYQVGPEGVKEGLVLSKAPAAGQSYSFTVRVGGGLVARQLPDGAVELAASESGTAAFTIPAPYMSDAKDDANSPYGKVYSRKVSQKMTFDAASGIVHLTVTPDAKWLADSKRVYPVTVDPTILVSPTPSTAANTMIQAEDPSGNNSTSWRLSVGTTTNGAVRTLIKFPLPSIPAGTTIASADLALYYDQTFTTDANNVPMQALQANAPWTPATATWTNASSIGGPVAGTATMTARAAGVWVHFPVASAVQNWVNGTTNNGFVLKATNEATLGQGGPRFEGSIYAYGGEVVNYPRLVITYGVPGVAVNPPSVIHATGAELSWPAYTNTTGNADNDLAEYQVHRSVFESFTPAQNTLLAPVASTSKSFVDSTAVPTAADNSDPYGNAYYYMVAVKTKGGKLIPGPTQLVRLPKAGRTTLLVPVVAATTLASGQPTTVLNTLSNSGTAEPWLEVGDNSSTYGVARSVFDFGALSQVPAGSKVLDAYLKAWQETTTTGTTGAVYELHGLTRSFTGTQATWNSAATGTAWTTAGGDFSTTVGGTVSGLTNDPSRQNFDATSIVQGWVTTPSGNHGLLVKLKAEASTSPQERTIFAGPKTAEPSLAPQLVVTYLDTSTAATYYAPSTPTDMVVGQTYNTPVTINNTTSATWPAASEVLTYHWLQPDGTDVTGSANQLRTKLPADLAAGATVTLNAQVTPPAPTGGNESEGYSIAWDMLDTSTGTYLSGGTAASASKNAGAVPAAGTSGAGSLKQQVSVDPSGNNQLGLEHFYQYSTTPTGAGTNLYTNISSGNTVWNYDILSNPSVGFTTLLRLSYNSLSTFDTGNGFGWSIEASTPTRLGQALQITPPGNPNEVVAVDGTGNAHKWTLNTTTNQWDSPPGVHLHLQKLNPDCKPQTEDARAWSMTRPDRTVYYFDCAGFPTSTVDNNGNEADFTYSHRQSQNKPTEFLTYITDPMFRQTLTLTYYNKGDSYSYVDPATGLLVAATNLTAPGIVDSIKSITDVSGRTINFYYTLNGLLGRLVDGANDSSLAKTFNFTYDATQGMKNVKLATVKDPLGHTSNLSYYPTSSTWKWMTQSVTDRLNQITKFDYLAQEPTTGASQQTVVTNGNGHPWTYQIDSAGRMVQVTDPNTHTTKLAWDTDNNVKTLTEANGAVTTYTYDPKTGYPLTEIDPQEAPLSTTYTYQYSPDGYIADLTDVTSPAGRRTHYEYYKDAAGNSTGNVYTVREPKGTATGSGYTTTYDYDSAGRVVTVTDANGHPTTYGYLRADIPESVYDPTGLPTTVFDPLGHVTTTVYGPRGEPTTVFDPNGAKATQNYDVFGRPTDATIPKDHTANPPVVINYPKPVYDRNDNIVSSTDPAGAVTTAVYDANDQLSSTTLPPNDSAAARVISYTYDSVGNQQTVTEPIGNVLKDGSYKTTLGYDDANQLTSVTDAMNHVTVIGYDNVGNKQTVQEPKGTKAKDSSYATTYGYDKDHRQTTTKDALGNTSVVGYDPDGLVVSSSDQNGVRTTYSLDQNGRVYQVHVPHSGDKSVECEPTNANITCNTTGYTYDPVGNLTAVSSPRSFADGVTPGSFTTEATYNAANQRVTEYGAYDASLDANNRYGKNFRPQTDYTYDADGRVRSVTQWVREPDKQPTSITSTTDYFDTGWIRHTTDPFNITTDYDYNNRGQQTFRKLIPAELSTADADVARQMNWGYYTDGSLASSTDTGLPNSWQDQILTADSATAWARGVGCTPGAPGTGYNGSTFSDCGTSFSWNISVPDGADGDYSVYVWIPKDAHMASGDPAIYGNPSIYYVDDPNHSNNHVDVTQSDHAGSWVQLSNPANSTGKWTFKPGMHTIEMTAGIADAVRVVRNDTTGTGGTTPQPPVSFTFHYDANGNQHELDDLSPTDPATAAGTPTAQFNQYLTEFDPLDRPYQLQEMKGATVAHKLIYGYDDNGNLKSLNNDAATNIYDYDGRDALIHVSNQQSAGGPVVNTGYSYFPNGQRETQTKGNNDAVSYSYNLDGTLSRMLETTGYPQLNQVDVHNLTYDANNNISQDIFAVGNADQPAASLGRTQNYLYSPNNQLTRVNKESDTKAKESYDYDSLGEITKQTLGDQPEDQTVDNTYDRGRLVSSTPEQTDFPTVGYQYDAAGRMTIVGNRLLTPNDPTSTFTAEASQQYRYDGFDNIVYQASSAKLGTADQFTTSTASAYDSLNRAITSSSFVNATPPPDPNAPPPDPNAPPPDPNAGKIGDQTFDYLATSKTVNTEQAIFAAGGTDTKTYDYDPSGERLAMEHSVFIEPPGSNETLYYTYDPHQDVEALTGADGFPVTTYGYTAYGLDDRVAYKGDTPPTMDSGRDKPIQGPDGTDIPDLYPLNTYRFNSARQAASTGNLDMGFRTYNPGIGQFLNRDSYDGAGADAGLAGGRYGFGGGNPLSNIELDGHISKATGDAIAMGVIGAVGCAFVAAATVGVGGLACAVAFGALTGVTYQSDLCAAGQGSCSGAALGKAALIGAVGGLAGGLLGGATAAVLPEAMAGWATGAIAGTVGGAAGGAAAYGTGCALGSECSVGGLGKAAAEGAAFGAVFGTAFGAAEDITGGAGGCSFSADTRVQLADGSTKNISDLKPGDKVKSTDTTTGKTKDSTTSAVWVNHDTDLYDLTVHTGTGDQVIHTTANHRFYDHTTHSWVEAAKLHKGDQLTTDDGTTVTVKGGATPANSTGDMWDITVPGDHDFYVVAGTTAVLVHNACYAKRTESRNLVAAAVERQLQRGWADIAQGHLKPGELEAYYNDVDNGKWGGARRWLGTAIHRAVEEDLTATHGARFEYTANKDPDFLDTQNDVRVELTTRADFLDHWFFRTPLYMKAMYVFYARPGQLPGRP
ncbi:DNRLRE domain-containing protein [Rugosimonospora africana]|uniref:DNRLRE domain-containing protein n=1 Tax=Rugosimonospora africana TaxID=556532 RepID=UPI0019424499|nr:DNRLRE domain-containing protein [Rugosimonospora africana]